MAFEGKRVIVTGAGRGLGAALAVVLADQGAEVMLTGRNTENLTSLAESIRLRCGRKPQLRLLDMTDPSAVTLFAKGLRDEGRPLDILINTAAQWLPGHMEEHDALAISQTIALGRQNNMPAQESRLGDTRTRLLAAYVLSLGEGSRVADARQP